MSRSFLLFHTASFPVGRESVPFFSWKCISEVFAANKFLQKLQKLGGGSLYLVLLCLRMSLFSSRGLTLLKNITPLPPHSPLWFLALQIPSNFVSFTCFSFSAPLPPHRNILFIEDQHVSTVYLVHDCIPTQKSSWHIVGAQYVFAG